MKRAAIYVRVSTTKDSQKDSPEHQASVCKERARQMEFAVSEDIVYEDRDTGTTIIDRPAIQQLLEDARKRRFDIVIFAAMSRFARDTGDALDLKRKLVNALGVRLISIDEGYDSGVDLDELKFTIMSAVNQKFSEQISESSRRGKRESAAKGNFTGSKAPYGYKRLVTDKAKILVPNEETKHVVQTIYQLYTANKMGEKAIVNYLNEKGIHAPIKKLWGLSTVQGILQNEAYIGSNTFCKYETKKIFPDINNMADRRKVQVKRDRSEWKKANNPNTHEGIIDEETFWLAQKLRLERGGGQRGGIRNKANVFAGIIKCADCGAAMVSMRSKARKTDPEGQEYRYLICSKRRRQGDAGCYNNYWLPYYPFRDELLEWLSSAFREISSAEELFEKHKGLIRINQRDIELEITKVKKAITLNRDCVFQLRKAKMLGEIEDEEQYEHEKSSYETEIKELEGRLARMISEQQQQMDLTALYENVMEMLDELLDIDFDQFDEMQLILKRLISEIAVHQSGEVKVMTTFGIPLSEMQTNSVEVGSV
ncbi:recombinase family protein [Gorillibacterium massiliense]|uniref:recombinase family protein n=1 Tax=Gorillibacterium massiliense TaxID=1280390 RepID=UPI0004B58317|nr:recombinase family protein [Gorillibacterium massiliense]